MPDFPKREGDIAALAKSVIAGYIAHPEVFPGADPAALQADLDAFKAAKNLQVRKQAEAQLAKQAKDGTLHQLRGRLKTQLKRSEADTAADPEQLELLGWAPKATARPVDPPGQPREVRSLAEGAGNVTLEWKSPASTDGGRVRTYVIERREQSETGGVFGEWCQVGVALETRIVLEAQPRHRDLEYRILALNHAGQSPQSNVVAVVL